MSDGAENETASDSDQATEAKIPKLDDSATSENPCTKLVSEAKVLQSSPVMYSHTEADKNSEVTDASVLSLPPPPPPAADVWEPTANFDVLLGFGLAPSIARAIDELYSEQILTEPVRDETIDILCNMNEEAASNAVSTLRSRDKTYVRNRSRFFHGIVRSIALKSGVNVEQDKTLLQSTQAQQSYSYSNISTTESMEAQRARALSASTNIVQTNPYANSYMLNQAVYSSAMQTPVQSQTDVNYGATYSTYTDSQINYENKFGPSLEKMNEIVSRSGYPYEYTETTRRYGPPPDWVGSEPGSGFQLYVKRIPANVYEDELIPLFEQAGKIYELRVMTDPASKSNKGYAFLTMCTKEAAREVINRFNAFMIRPGWRMFVSFSLSFTRLFLGNIPCHKTKDEIFSAIHDECNTLSDVEVTADSEKNLENKGFCFLKFDSYREAAFARQKLLKGTIRAWGHYNKFVIDWAVPLENPDEEAAKNSKTILVSKIETDVSESDLIIHFNRYGPVIKVHKDHNYAFIDFSEREHALAAEEGEKTNASMNVQVHTPMTEAAKKMANALKTSINQQKYEKYNSFRPKSTGYGFKSAFSGNSKNYGSQQGYYFGDNRNYSSNAPSRASWTPQSLQTQQSASNAAATASSGDNLWWNF